MLLRQCQTLKKRYVQIEKEVLGVTWASEKCSDYLMGMHFMIESDHKPLIPLLGSKNLNMLPRRILHFCLQLARYKYSITHVCGKLLYTADTLSTVPPDRFKGKQSKPTGRISRKLHGRNCFYFPTTSQGLEKYRTARMQHATCLKVREYTPTSWPEKNSARRHLDTLLA